MHLITRVTTQQDHVRPYQTDGFTRRMASGNTIYQVETRLPLKGLVMMPVNSEKSSNGKTIRRSHFASREAWHAACEAFLGDLCHYCEERSAGPPLCGNCQRSLLRLMAAGEDLGLCGCRGVEEWFFECSRAYERPSEEIEPQDALDEIMPKTELLTEVPTSILVAEAMDTGEVVRDTADFSVT